MHLVEVLLLLVWPSLKSKTQILGGKQLRKPTLVLNGVLKMGNSQGELGFYDKKSKDLLMNVKVPSVTGDKDGIVLTNAASIRNRGLEASVNWKTRINPNFSYNIGGNITLNKNTVIGLNGGQPILDGGIGAGRQYTTKTDNGQPVGSFYVYNVLGSFPNRRRSHSL